MKRRSLFTLSCLLALFLLFAGSGARQAAAEEPTAFYAENEWNFAEGSMDVSGGIPEDVTGNLARIIRNGVLRVATVSSPLPPWVFPDPEADSPDQLAGADIRLAQCIADRMGVKLKLIPLEETQILPALMEEQCDLTIAAISYTPRRALSYTLSKAYDYSGNTAQTGLIIREDKREEITSLADLKGRMLVAERNSLPELVGAMQSVNYQEFRRVSSPQAVFETVARGDADAGFVLVRTAKMYLRLYPDCGLCLADGLVFNPDRAVQGLRVAAKKGETQLIYYVNGVIDGLLTADAYEDWVEEAEAQASELGL